MTKIVLQGRKVIGGVAEGRALVSSQPVAFCAGIDPLKGTITERGHELNGESLTNQVLVCPSGKGSSAFSKAAYALWLAGKAPVACIFGKVDPKTALASIVMRTPAVTDLEQDPLELIETGDYIKVNGDKGIVEINKR